MPYQIIYAPQTREHFRHLTAQQRSIVLDNIGAQLIHEPTVETRSRKRMRPNALAAWELRIGDLRVYYEVIDEAQTVRILAVGIKRGNRVDIGGIWRDL